MSKQAKKKDVAKRKGRKPATKKAQQKKRKKDRDEEDDEEQEGFVPTVDVAAFKAQKGAARPIEVSGGGPAKPVKGASESQSAYEKD